MRLPRLTLAAALLLLGAGAAAAQKPGSAPPEEKPIAPPTTGTSSRMDAESRDGQLGGSRTSASDLSAPTEALARGKWEYDRNSYQNAFEWYSKAASLYLDRTKAVPALVGKALAQYRLKDYQGSLATLDELAARYPDDVRQGTDVRKKVEKAMEKEAKKVTKDKP